MECLDEKQVFDLVGGLMEKSIRVQALEHVRGCDKCTARVKDSKEQLMAKTFSPRQVSFAATEPEEEEFDEITEPQGLRGGLPEVGKVLAGRYKLNRVLGHGGMGVVFEAEDLTLKLTVALKLLVRELAAHRSYVEQLHQEIRLSRRITSPRVCRVHDLGTDGMLHFLVMERLSGTPLDRRIEETGALPTEQAFDILDQLCEALQAAEEAGVVHRDLKPANVMIDEQGKVKVMDFGLARDARVDKSQYGGAKGTPAYWAPEQARGEPATAASDVFALGMTALDLFSGQFPWQRSSSAGMNALPKALVPVVSKCLEQEPKKRYPNATALRAAFQAAHRETVAGGGTLRWALPLAGGLAAAAVLALVLYPKPAAQPFVEVNPPQQLEVKPVEKPVVVQPEVEQPKVKEEVEAPHKPVIKKKPVEEAPAVEQKVVAEEPRPVKPAVSPEELAAARGSADAIEKSLTAKALLPGDVPNFSEQLGKARALIADGKLADAKPLLQNLEHQAASAKVDAQLVGTKTQRLNAELKARNLPPEKSAPLYKLFEQVQASYFKGDYAAANRSLNEIKAALDARSP